MKQKIKYMIAFIIGGIVCTSIGVYATITYQASQIKYTKSDNTEVTLDSALNELYTDANTTISTLNSNLNNYKSFNTIIYADSSSTGRFKTIFALSSDLKSKYSHFRVSDLSQSGSNPTCSISAYKGGSIDISLGTDYSTSYANQVEVTSNSSSTSWGRCQVTVTLFNK